MRRIWVYGMVLAIIFCLFVAFHWRQSHNAVAKASALDQLIQTYLNRPDYTPGQIPEAQRQELLQLLDRRRQLAAYLDHDPLHQFEIGTAYPNLQTEQGIKTLITAYTNRQRIVER